MPPPPFKINQMAYHGELEGLNNESYNVAFMYSSHILIAIDHQNKSAYVVIEDPSKITSLDKYAPLRNILKKVLPKFEKHVIHSAAVGTDNGAILVVGYSGMGKSSVALQSLQDGMNFLGDDLCAISISNNIPMIYSISTTGKIYLDDLVHYRSLSQALEENSDHSLSKAVFNFFPGFGKQLAYAGKIKAIIVPSLSQDELSLKPIPIAKVLSIIFSDLKVISPSSSDQSLPILLEILKSVPCYEFHLGSDRNMISPVLQSICNSSTYHHSLFHASS